ncbi:tetratricopeptide repeat protein [Methylobacterium flocculans]|jgi:TPR repeat protein|uniref:tetratricopeptide repeat protein n=1 Tax=Methylobacterium flocculans TaxID=2984843 RepID=UPI0021F3A67D|nr:tetratricopeptide repeat protein [Methylobacterium sp. FF17]
MRQRLNPTKPKLNAPGWAAPTLASLHRHSEADWQRIFATQPDAAVAWIQLSARSGFKAAQLVLGQMHLDGQGVARDSALAYGWFMKAAALGSIEARNMVGRCHELGWGVPVDQAEALCHYRKAAAAGLAWGHYNAGCLLLYGTGLRRDHQQALSHFLAAASQEHAKAMGLLGRCHEEGWGVPVDQAAAATWYARAAEGGDCWGAFNLGLMQAETGASRDAAIWMERAVAAATPNCLAVIVKTLVSHSDPKLRQIALMASDLLLPESLKTAYAVPVLDRLTVHASVRSRKSLGSLHSAAAAVFGLALLLLAHVLPMNRRAG